MTKTTDLRICLNCIIVLLQYGPFGDDLVQALGNRDLHLIRGQVLGHSHEPHSSHR